MDKIANIAGLIVMVAGVTTVVRSRRSAAVIRAMGDAFSHSISAALGAHR